MPQRSDGDQVDVGYEVDPRGIDRSETMICRFCGGFAVWSGWGCNSFRHTVCTRCGSTDCVDWVDQIRREEDDEDGAQELESQDGRS